MTQTNTIRRMQIKDEEGGLVGIFVDVAKLVPRLQSILTEAEKSVTVAGEINILTYSLKDLIEELIR